MSKSHNEPREAAHEKESPMTEHELHVRAHREVHKQHLVLWIATGTTLLLVIALWIMILPTQLSGRGAKTTSSWLSPSNADTDRAPAQTFSELMQAARQKLNTIEGQIRAQNTEQNAVQTETARLRARIEGAAAANTAAETNTNTATSTNTATKTTTKKK